MGRDIAGDDDGGGELPLESRPSVFLIGSPNVGKRTLLSRLLSIDIPETSDLSSGVCCHGWTMDTKYYSADLSIWTTHLDEGFSFDALPISRKLVALVMVFDMSDEASFIALQNWVAGIDLQKFEILLCIGNKADLVPGHYAHTGYRRWLQKHGNSSSDPHPEFINYGIDEVETYSLLGEEGLSLEIRKSSLEWCIKYNIEFIEACASNADFDKCLSVDGDIQGVERLYGALAAHMWPGMVLKSGNRMNTSLTFQREDLTDDDSEYEIEYELLSGPDEPYDDPSEPSFSFNELHVHRTEDGLIVDGLQIRNTNAEVVDHDQDEVEISAAREAVTPDVTPVPNMGKETNGNAVDRAPNQKHGEYSSANQKSISAAEVHGRNDVILANSLLDEDGHLGLDDLERLMGEISNIRDNLRLMPDNQRRDMAANLALKMASMFGDSSDEDGF